MAESDQQRLHAFVHGRVQGVGFRHFVMMEASTLEITGWVRNRRDGSVEVIAEGEHQQLEKLLRALHRGPGSANVTRVDQEWENYTGKFFGFKVRMTS